MADQSSRHEAAPGRLPKVNSISFKELCQRPRTFTMQGRWHTACQGGDELSELSNRVTQ